MINFTGGLTGFRTILFMMLTGCSISVWSQSAAGYKEKFRPQYHFSPPAHWMNDPNGMVYYDGEYHLFYQYYPGGNTWGPMHWGHAVSTDMLHWKHLPIALYPDSNGYIFSGSVVVDYNNTSGLGSPNNPAMVAIFTYHSMEKEKAGRTDYQNQALAYSIDKGRTWTKYAGNPVLGNPGIKDFRDPKISWFEPEKKWMMSLAVKDRICFYSSSNLIQWEYTGEFHPAIGAYGGVWECPDLFPLKTKEGEEKWILFVSINPGAPWGGSGTQYFVGNFNGKTFSTNQTEVLWLDKGTDNYAGVTWWGVPAADGRRLFMGWMSNWLYAQEVPTEKWRSAMTIPRELTLKKSGQNFRVQSHPVDELKRIRKNMSLESTDTFQLSSALSELEMEVEKVDFEVILENQAGEYLQIKKSGDTLYVDRTQAGNSSFSSDFASILRIPLQKELIQNLQLYIDAASVELFINKGDVAVTSLVFPTHSYSRVKTKGIKKEVIHYSLNPVW